MAERMHRLCLKEILVREAIAFGMLPRVQDSWFRVLHLGGVVGTEPDLGSDLQGTSNEKA